MEKNWKIEKKILVVLIADGRSFAYLILFFIQLIFRESSISE